MKGLIGPGSTIGIIGGGQLGNMILREAHRWGYRVHVLDPSPEAPAGRRADAFTVAAFDDMEGLKRLAEDSDVATLEIEHVPAPGLQEIATTVPVRPRPEIFHIIQDRARQRAFLEENGFPQPKNAPVEQESDLSRALETTGAPAILKTRRGGYDGKGQARILSEEGLEDAWSKIGGRPGVLEAFVEFEKEISVLLARGTDGETRAYPVAENVHKNGILHTTRVPARVDEAVARKAVALTRDIAQALDHVGVLCVEMFLTKQDGLLVNEIAPRIHNSGHFTEAACATPQGEQHLRAITGIPLGPTTLHRGAVMVNLLGDAWESGPPDWAPLLQEEEARLHLYGKHEARPGRKMGHFIVTGDDPDTCYRKAGAIYERIMRPHQKTQTQTSH